MKKKKKMKLKIPKRKIEEKRNKELKKTDNFKNIYKKLDIK